MNKNSDFVLKYCNEEKACIEPRSKRSRFLGSIVGQIFVLNSMAFRVESIAGKRAYLSRATDLETEIKEGDLVDV